MINQLRERLRTRVRREPSQQRVRTPTILQMEAVECGAASLAIILGYLGRRVPIEELRTACDVSRDGTKASNILAAARRYGLKGKGFRKEPDGLRTMKMPCILHWNFQHFLVLEGFGKNRAFLSDPASGRYSVTLQELSDAFTGVVLVLEPTDEFQPVRAAHGVLAKLAPRLRGSGGALLYAGLASLGLIVLGLAVPTFTRVFVDELLVKRLTDWLFPLLGIMVGVAATQSVLVWLQGRCLMRLDGKLSLSSSGTFVWHLLRLPVEFFTQRYAGEIAGRVQLNDRLAELVSREILGALLNMVLVVFYLGLMLLYSVPLTLVTVGLSTLTIGSSIWAVRRSADSSRRFAMDAGKMGGMTMNGLKSIETLKAAGAESDFFSKWAGHLAKVSNAQMELAARYRSAGPVPQLLTFLNSSAVFALGALAVMQGNLSIGGLFAFRYLADSFLQPLGGLSRLLSTLQEAQNDVDRLDDVLRYPADAYASNLGDAPQWRPEDGGAKLRGQLELRDVSFGYSRNARPLIDHFDLRLEPGSRVALVGGSGSGKSTIARLVTGLYSPTSGQILFDGVRRESIPRTVLTSSMAMVDQDVMLFEDSVRANITLWDRTITDEQLVRAARDAAIHADIAARPGGYDSPVAEGGSNYSGGQRQRLEIARALVQNPTLLVLDEGTSALDTTTEKDVMDNLRRRGCSCLVVAHRLSTIRDCDEIVVMQAGAVVERGPHDVLSRAGGAYAELIGAS